MVDGGEVEGSGDKHWEARVLVMDAGPGGFANPWLDRRDCWLVGEKPGEAS